MPKSEPMYKNFAAVVKAVDAMQGQVTAVVNVFGIVDLGDDIVHAGSCAKTIQERAGKIRVCDSHNTNSVLDVVGKIVSIREINRAELPVEIASQHPEATGGLEVIQQYWMDDAKSKAVFLRIQEGAITEYSIGFRIVRQDYSKVNVEGKDKTVRNIREMELFEISPVLWGMNQATMTTATKAQPDAPNYRAMPATAAQRCESCSFFEAGGHCARFDFQASEEMICDSYAAKALKEMTPEGAIRRLGDYVVGEMVDEAMECLGKAMTEHGLISFQEYATLVNSVLAHVQAIRGEMDENIAMREMPPEPMMMWGDTPDPELKTRTTPAEPPIAAPPAEARTNDTQLKAEIEAFLATLEV